MNGHKSSFHREEAGVCISKKMLSPSDRREDEPHLKQEEQTMVVSQVPIILERFLRGADVGIYRDTTGASV